uniref:Uncharacterized protein n=1 Tax=Physcomitrium patens TaxID=3218 RepID=A0A2K1KT49_PHYPA|nr:hypothetical protein PHYPA_003919 [Physcomitrium patens]
MDRKVDTCYEGACGIPSCLTRHDFKMEKHKSSYCFAWQLMAVVYEVKGILAMMKKKPQK